ncbi:unnamed protein product [Rotaria socialis]|uniref:C2H2-type domain-containing protein n=1 Tax=Rotaria socialis TaxID=392032 RepID=A0A817W277_9BILA|nr:unnamed protein product [Rotaria socialis]CAF4332922.1 unnamed protein product [Rotaria socialis]
MASKTSQFTLYKSFVDAFTTGHPNMTKYACHYNAQLEWKKLKNNEDLIKKNIEKYLEASKISNENETKESSSTKNISTQEKITTNERKRTLSSDDDELEPYELNLESEFVTPVEPTFTKRDSSQPTEFNDLSKPWVYRSFERARARVEARVAKIQARRVASENRIKTPAQEAVIEQIKDISERIASLVQVKNMGLSTTDSNITLKKLLQQKKERASELRCLISKQRSSARYRERKKRCIESICAADPEVAATLLKFYKPTTLRVQIDNVCPDLIQTIEDIARIGGAIDANPRLINTQPCSSLDELRQKIKERNFEIRRSSNFYRLIPSGIFTEDGKRHVNSKAVRLRKIKDIEQSKHEDCHFVSATLQHIKDLAGTFGNDCVFYLVEDRRASVRIGRPSARGHSPFIMHLDYQISTSDSTPIPPTITHQFEPTVYASCVIDETGLIGFSGPTYVSIRSAKHDRFTVDHEDLDFDCVVKLKEFEKTARNHVGTIKPIIIMGIDSLKPNDYTRFPKTLTTAINRFKKYNLDAFFIVTQAPGQATFNVAERRLAVLSQDLTGLVLPHDYFGTHLNVSGVTIDAETEKLNLKTTGEVLAEVWSMDMIDRHPVVAQYMDPPSSTDDMVRLIDAQSTMDSIIDDICDEEEEIPLHLRVKHMRSTQHLNVLPDTKPKPIYNIDEYWCATHVFQTQYTIQIVRCTKPECCGPWRSNYIQVFPHRFLPSPVPFDRSSHGVRLAQLEASFANMNPTSPYYGTLFQRIQFHGIVMQGTNNLLLPFDSYCPSVQAKLQSRVCSICKQYIPSPTRLRNHYKVHQQRYASNCIDYKFNKEEELIDESEPYDPNEMPLCQINRFHSGVFLFSDMIEWIKSDFEDEPIVETKQKSSATIANAMIRQERQLQEAAAAAMGLSSITMGQPKGIESVATIYVDDALDSTTDNTSLPEIKIESETITIIDVTTEKHDVNVCDSMDQLTVMDNQTALSKSQSQDSLNQYDDLSDLIDKI